jgi:hypothetical protein
LIVEAVKSMLDRAFTDTLPDPKKVGKPTEAFSEMLSNALRDRVDALIVLKKAFGASKGESSC